MEIYHEKFGALDVYVEDKLNGDMAQLKRSTSKGPNTKTTSTKPLSIKPSRIRELLKSVVESFGEDMDKLKNTTGVTTMELELSLSMKAGFWIIENEGQLSLKLVWENK